jgi:two-component system nitrogen regulation response regulator NtrX
MTYRILMIDDDAAFWLPCIGYVAEASSFDVDIALTPSQCRSILLEESFDLVLLDIWFHDAREDGLSLLRVLRRQQPETKVVMFSGRDDAETVATCARLGAHGFVSKNASPERLWQEIARVLGDKVSGG